MARRIVLQEPESGLEVFLKEISKYASPQYQLSLREQERADARLKLSERQMNENEDRYQDSLRQQKFQNNIASKNAEINKEKFQIEKSNSDFEIAKQYINESFSGMNAQDIANINIDSLLIDVADPRAKSRARQYANNIQKSGRRQLQTITSRMNLYNQGKDADSQISKAEALDLFGDDNTYNEFLVSNYLKQGSLNDEQKYLINSNTTRLTALRKQQADLLTQQASGMDVTDALSQNTIVIQNLQGEIDSILQTPNTQRGDSSRDPYSGIDALDNPLGNDQVLSPLAVEDGFYTDDMYNVLFSDGEDIVESAVDAASKNASGKDVENVSIPSSGDFTDVLLSGLSSAKAEENKKPKRKTRSKFLPLIDFTSRLNKLDSFQEQLDKTPVKNEKKQKSLNNKIDKIKKSIVKDFSKIYDSSEGSLSIDPRYTERTKSSASMSRNELARLISLYNESGGDINEQSASNNFKNTMSKGFDNTLQGLEQTLDLLGYKAPFR